MKSQNKYNFYTVVFSSTGQSPLAYVAGCAISLTTFKSDVTKLVEQLQKSQVKQILITTTGRYAFSVALLASWLVEATVILPPDQHAKSIEKIRAQHAPGFECDDRWREQLGSPQAKHKHQHGVWSLELRADLVAVQLYTSGTSGKPVAVKKTVANLLEEANCIKSSFAWPDAAIVGTVPAQHLYGLTFSMLLPWVSGLPWVDEVPLYPQDIVNVIKHCQAGALVSVPAHYNALIEETGVPTDLVCVSAAAPLTSTTARHWYEKNQQHILEIYGSTETGVVAYRHQLINDDWQAFSPVSVDLRTGLLHVNSPFVSEHTELGFQTADRATFTENQRFQLLGRSDAIVKIGGKRVSLRVVEQMLMSCDGVKDAAVIVVEVKSVVRDQAIWAVLETEKANPLSIRDLRIALCHKLDGVSIPRRFALVDRLPRNTRGKLSRNALLEAFEGEASSNV